MTHDNFNFLEMFGETTQHKVDIFDIKEKIFTYVLDIEHYS